MRKVVQELTGVLPGNKDKDLATIALCSVTKMFVGEVVETGGLAGGGWVGWRAHTHHRWQQPS
jgi:hypothetical protein